MPKYETSKLDDWKFLVGYWMFDSPVTPPHHPSALGAAANRTREWVAPTGIG